MATVAQQQYTDGEVFTRRAVIHGESEYDGDGEFAAAYGVHLEVTLKAPLGRGKRTEVRKCIDKAVLDRIAHVPYPFLADVHMVEFASKKATSLTIVDIKPVERAAAPAGKA